MQIEVHQRGLVYKNGGLIKVLMPGLHWNVSLKNTEVHSIFEELIPTADLSIVLEHAELAGQVEVYQLADHNIALLFEDGNFVKVLTPGKHAFWKNAKKRDLRVVDLNNPMIDPSIDRKVLTNRQVQEYVAGYTVEAYETGLLFIEKRFERSLEPSNYFFWKGNKSINLIKADLRQQQLEISGQEIMTKDKVSLRLSFICQYKITNPVIALVESNDFEKQLYARLQLMLREYIGSLTLDEILDKKEDINLFILTSLKSEENKLGLEVVFAGIKDVILPGDIKEIINQVLVAEKRAQANVITRREETASTRSLLNTAKLMEDNEILLKLKELEYVERISEKISQISITGGGHLIEQLKEMLTHFSK